MKIKFLIALTFIFFLLSFQSDEEDELITLQWNPERPLTWKDFKGKADPESTYDAWTYFGISYVYSWYYQDDLIRPDLNAWAYFDPEQSWIKKEKATPELLAHEQIHFDIAEYYCRIFCARVYTFESYNLNVEAQMDSIYAATHIDMMNMQQKYDQETDHFNNKAAQAEWNSSIKHLLETTRIYE